LSETFGRQNNNGLSELPPSKLMPRFPAQSFFATMRAEDVQGLASTEER